MTIGESDAKLIECYDKGGVRVIKFVDKELGLGFDSEGLSREMSEAIEGLEKPKVVVNFDEVAYVASLVIATLIRLHEQIWEAGGKMRFSNVTDYVHETFRAAKLHRLTDIHTTEEEAIQSFEE